MIVCTAGLTKRYGSFAALDGCTLEVREGEVFGLLGPNGAGKTTLLRLLLGYLGPTAGTATVAGFDCATQSLEVRTRTAYLPGEARLFRRMNGHAVLDFFSGLRRECRRETATAVADRLSLDCSRQVARMRSVTLNTQLRQVVGLTMSKAGVTRTRHSVTPFTSTTSKPFLTIRSMSFEPRFFVNGSRQLIRVFRRSNGRTLAIPMSHSIRAKQLGLAWICLPIVEMAHL